MSRWFLVKRAMRRAGVLEHAIAAYREEALAHDYAHMLKVTGMWVKLTTPRKDTTP